VLVRPKCDCLGKEALDRAKHAKSILQKAVVHKGPGMPEFDYLVGTTSQLGKDYHILRTPVTPRQLAGRLAEISSKSCSIGLVFGPEGQGLSNEQLLECDYLVTIPTSRKNPVMNLSHSVGVILYEIFAATAEEHIITGFRPITDIEKKRLTGMVEESLDHLPFSMDAKRETQRRLWKHIIGRSMLTKREAYALMGFLAKILKLPKRKKPSAK
jgi:tRNA/rRNA methyltransferase